MVKIQQFHKSAQSARRYIAKSMKTPHSTLRRDYGDCVVSSVRLAKKVHNEPNVPVNGRRLYNITLRKRK